MRHDHHLIERARRDFLEMPGMRLTPEQASRLWGIDAAKCREVIDALVAAAFLRWTARGQLARMD